MLKDVHSLQFLMEQKLCYRLKNSTVFLRTAHDSEFKTVFYKLLCPMSKSLSGKREGLQDNATGKKGKFITDSSQGPLPHPTQWCRSEP